MKFVGLSSQPLTVEMVAEMPIVSVLGRFNLSDVNVLCDGSTVCSKDFQYRSS